MRPYLMVGTVGLVLMVPLAATSTNGMIKRLGPTRWKALHRLAYVAAAAGALHYYMLVKADVSQPIAFATVLGMLFLYRLGAHYWQLRTDAWKYRSGPHLPRRPSVPAPCGAVENLGRATAGHPSIRRDVRGSYVPPRFGRRAPPSVRLPPGPVPEPYARYRRAESPPVLHDCVCPDQDRVLRVDGQAGAKGAGVAAPARRRQGGRLLEVRAPAGQFKFTGAEAGKRRAVAGGVGITPLMAQIRYLTDLSWPGDIYLVFSVKTERDIIFRDELDALEATAPEPARHGHAHTR